MAHSYCMIIYLIYRPLDRCINYKIACLQSTVVDQFFSLCSTLIPKNGVIYL